ncbi:hypothetical protein Q6326_30955, partial [Klebsiella pneumoniae]
SNMLEGVALQTADPVLPVLRVGEFVPSGVMATVGGFLKGYGLCLRCSYLSPQALALCNRVNTCCDPLPKFTGLFTCASKGH